FLALSRLKSLKNAFLGDFQVLNRPLDQLIRVQAAPKSIVNRYTATASRTSILPVTAADSG
ncbi:hypothetical protein, partial [Sphingorhabdus sp.]|uniref:hypothetical protein n=1 Tax=Sphingorhabdus sp. TaxID=1902408 RepID=UPI003342BD60